MGHTQEPAPDNRSGIDPGVLAELRAALGGPADDNPLADLLDTFLEGLTENLVALDTALAGGSTALARRVAHQILGTSGIVGAVELGRRAAEVELAAAAGHLGAAREAWPALVSEAQQVRDELAGWSEEGPTTPAGDTA